MRHLSTVTLSVLGLALVATPASAQILDLGDGGAFTNLAVPANVTRNVGAFWDNTSADNSGAATNCNVGFYATGNFNANCVNQTAGTFANQGGYSYYWGNGASGFGSPAFMFSGADGYTVSLLGAVAGRTSQIGVFTRSSTGTYTFQDVPAFGSRTVGSTFTIAPGQDWGFFIKNAFNPNSGCAAFTNCSDATGGFSSAPFQQFALFSTSNVNSGLGRYLVGAEDNGLELLPNGFFRDSDYNDYLISVTATPEPLTMGLLATGLVSLAGVGYIRRRREQSRNQ